MKFKIFFFFLILNNFFGALSINNSLLLCLIFPFVVFEFRSYTVFKPFFILFGIGIVGNYLSSYYFRGQSFLDSFRAMPNFFYILFYFVLKSWKPSLKTIEKVLLVLILTLNIIYILQFILVPYGIMIVNIDEWMIGEDANTTRLRVMSSGLYSLGIFYGINKYSLTRKNIYLLCVILGMVVVLLTGYRSVLLAVLLFSIFMFYRLYGFSKKTVGFLLLGSIMMIGIAQISFVSEKIDYLISRQEGGDESLTNSDYIRVIQFNYFTQEFHKNNVEYVLGSGMPFTDSKYGKEFELKSASGLQYVDWGLLGLSWMMGIVPVLAMILYSVKAIRLKVESQYYYISVWFLFLLSVSLFNMEFYRNGNFLVQAIALYIVELAFFRRKYKIAKISYISFTGGIDSKRKSFLKVSRNNKF